MGWLKKLWGGAKREAKKEAVNIIRSPELASYLENQFKNKAVNMINRKLDIPLLNEKQEAVLYGIIYDVFIGAATNFIKKKI